MDILSGLAIIIIGFLVYSSGSKILGPYLCTQCTGFNIINPVCQIQKQGCKLFLLPFVGFGLIIVGLIVMVRK